MSIDKDYILDRQREDPSIVFYDVLYPNRKDYVESFDNDQFTHAQVTERLKHLLESLSGTYIVRLRTKSKAETGKGGSIRPAGEYTVQFGNASNSIQGMSGMNQAPQMGGIGYMEKYLEEKTNSISERYKYEMELYKLRREFEDFKRKKNNDSGGMGGPLEQMMVQVLSKEYLGITIPPAPIAAHSINGVGEAITETESEQRSVKALTRLAAINPGAVVMLENLATTLELHPDKIDGINAALANAASGQPLITSFMVLAQ